MRRLAAIVDGADLAIVGQDLDGRIESWNRGAEAFYGYKEQEVLGRSTKILVPSEDSDEVDRIMQCIRQGKRVEHLETVRKKKNGDLIDVSLTVSPIYGDRGQVIGASAITSDIRDRVEAQRQLRRANDELERRVGERTSELAKLNKVLQTTLREQEQANRRLQREIEQRHRLERRILDISEHEQRRIGQDLHDGLGQLLTGMACLSQVLVDNLDKRGDETAEDARQVRQLADQALGQTRDLSRGLYPAELERYGFFVAIDSLARKTSELLKVGCSVEIEDNLEEPDGEVAMQLFRIAQEAISNGVRHGHAGRIRVTLRNSEDRWMLAVEDDGEGFDSDQPSGDGMGLAIMRHRAAAISAELSVSSIEEGGVRVKCCLPVGQGEQSGVRS